MTAQPLPALTGGDPSAWDQALYAFLVEKGNRSGSKRTVESYSRMLWRSLPTSPRTPDRAERRRGTPKGIRTPDLSLERAVS
jgi:hypothetical protein